MTLSQPNFSTASVLGQKKIAPLHLTTLVMLGIVAFTAAIAAAWFAGQGTIRAIFEQLNALQDNPPVWLMVPMVAGEFLLFWAVALMVLVLAITKISPRPRPWSRIIVVGILIVLTIRYVLWRILSTLNLSDPLNGVFSLGLLALELLMLVGGVIQLFLLLRVRDRRPEANRLSEAVGNGNFTPTVDILIPTYNEPIFILRRTVIGCQALEYPSKTVYLLDDTRRPEVQALADELNCQYLTRPDNRHAKAGNLNHALSLTQGELVVIFDADFVPTKNFLIRTVGFFQDPQVGLVQTPQSFYNSDPIARNLGLEDVLTPEEEVFYRQIQPVRDAAGGVICSGTSFVVRRSALTKIGGFVTESLSEDYFTGIHLASKGYRLVYLNEKLSAGLAAENISAQALQRIRWAQGTLQAFFIRFNPLTIRGLTPLQRLAHLEGLLHWFTSISRVGFLLMPLAYAFLGVIPLKASETELLYFFLPYYLVQLTAFSWLNFRSRSAFLSDIYSLVLTFPLALTVVQVMLNPFGKGFKVTPKGTASDRYSFNWRLAFPLIVVFILTALSLWLNLGMCLAMGALQPTLPAHTIEHLKGFGIGWLWSAYNLLMLGLALLILTDVPRPDPYDWFDLRRTVRLQVGEQIFWGSTTMLSEVGAEVAFTQKGFPAVGNCPKQQPTVEQLLPVTLELLEDRLIISGRAICTGFKGDFPTVRVLFDELSLSQQRCLTELLYCRPGQWRSRCSPGELRSLWILLKTLLHPQILFNRQVDVKAVTVAQS